MPTKDPSSETASASRWADFWPSALSNAAGTVIAAAVIYLFGVASGYFQGPNLWTRAGAVITPFVQLGVIFFLAYGITITIRRGQRWAAVQLGAWLVFMLFLMVTFVVAAISRGLYG